MIDPEWNNIPMTVPIPLEVHIERGIGDEYLLCVIVHLMEIEVDIFLSHEWIAHVEILWIFRMEGCCIGNPTPSTESRCCESDRSLSHDMDRIWLECLHPTIDLSREHERESDLLVSEEWNAEKIIRRDHLYFHILRQIGSEVLETTGDTIDLSFICIRHQEELHHAVREEKKS